MTPEIEQKIEKTFKKLEQEYLVAVRSLESRHNNEVLENMSSFERFGKHVAILYFVSFAGLISTAFFLLKGMT